MVNTSFPTLGGRMSVHPTIRHILAGGLVAAFFALPVHAKYAGPSGASGAKNVAAILETPVDDQYVKLQGHILKKTGHEKYTFRSEEHTSELQSLMRSSYAFLCLKKKKNT